MISFKEIAAKFSTLETYNFKNLFSYYHNNTQQALEVLDENWKPATRNSNGLMACTDKRKLDDLEFDTNDKIFFRNKASDEEYTDINTVIIDETTGLHVTPIGSKAIKLSIGSHFKFITDGNSTITAVGGDDVLTIKGDDSINIKYDTEDKSLEIGTNRYKHTFETESTVFEFDHNLGSFDIMNQVLVKNSQGHWQTELCSIVLISENRCRLEFTEACKPKVLLQAL